MNENIFVYLAIVMLMALLSSKLMKLIKLPNVTGYLIFGLLAGPYCLKILPLNTVEDLSILPEIALGLIAFSIGAEFKLSYMKKVGKSPLIIATIAAFGAVILVDLILILTGNDVSFSLLLGAIASATAPAATLMVVRQYKAKGPVTNMLLPVVAIDDAIALIVFGLSVAIVKLINSDGSASLATSLLDPVIEIIGAIIFGVVLGIILKYLTDWFTGRGNRLSISLAMVFLCIGISNLMGFSVLLACMTMSAVYVNISKVSGKVFEQVDRAVPPIYMIFFFISGAELDITMLPTVGLIGVLYIIFRAAGKILGSAVGSKISKTEPMIRKYLGYTLLPQAGVAIGLASVAASVVPEYGGKIKTIILCATVIYELTGPVITKISLKKAGEIESSKKA